jgi:hypothetical protein
MTPLDLFWYVFAVIAAISLGSIIALVPWILFAAIVGAAKSKTPAKTE